MSNKVAVITGGTAGVGFETCIQLASLEVSRFKKIYITSRSSGGAESAIKSFHEKTSCSKDMFGFLTLDLSSPKSCVDFVENLPDEIDVMVLNAGSISLKSLQEKTETGVTKNFHAGCIGTAMIVEKLLSSGKLKKGGRMFYAAGEVQRSVWLFTGFQPFPVWDKSKTAIYPSTPPTSIFGGVIGVRSMIAGMQNYKTFMSLYMSKVARENPDYYIYSVSPGGTITGLYDTWGQPLKFLVKFAPTRALFIALGAVHKVEKAGKRYVEAMCGPDFTENFKTGTIVMGKGIFGTAGKLADCTKQRKEFGDFEAQDLVAEVLRGEMKKVQDAAL